MDRQTKEIIVLVIAVIVGIFIDAFTGALLLVIHVRMTIDRIIEIFKKQAKLNVLQAKINQEQDDRLTKLENK